MNSIPDDYIMPFGKWRGKELGHIPADYLLWLYDQDWLPGSWPDIASYIAENYKALAQEKSRSFEIHEREDY